jgi:Ca2+-binding EF-hand superfamily protein
MANMRGKDRRRKGWRSSKGTSLIPQTKQRTTSNVFSMFDQTQIHELKEVFNFIDQNCDGFIDKDDLYETLQAFGEMGVTEEYLEQMINESPSYINLTMFLTLFGSKLNGTDPDEVFESAFRCLDADGTGRIHVGMLKRLLTETGDK